jgi:hypothetical protein
MGTRARKSKASKAGATHTQPGARKLRELIEGVIEAQHRGDPQQRAAALQALESFGGSGPLRQHATEARIAAQNAVEVDRVRLLNEIAARL